MMVVLMMRTTMMMMMMMMIMMRRVMMMMMMMMMVVRRRVQKRCMRARSEAMPEDAFWSEALTPRKRPFSWGKPCDKPRGMAWIMRICCGWDMSLIISCGCGPKCRVYRIPMKLWNYTSFLTNDKASNLFKAHLKLETTNISTMVTLKSKPTNILRTMSIMDLIWSQRTDSRQFISLPPEWTVSYHWKKHPHGSLNVPIEHHPTIRFH